MKTGLFVTILTGSCGQIQSQFMGERGLLCFLFEGAVFKPQKQKCCKNV